MSTPPTTGPTAPLIGRAVICLLGALFSFGVPGLRQGLDWDEPILHRWVMFTGYGLDICEVRYTTIDADGNVAPIDRFALMEQMNPGISTKGLHFIRTGKQARTLGKRLCAALGPAPDVRLFARCATHKGWRVAAKGNQNLCTSNSVTP